jgi:hypothetical protein
MLQWGSGHPVKIRISGLEHPCDAGYRERKPGKSFLFELFFIFAIPAYIIHKIFGITPTAKIYIVVHIFPFRIISISISPTKNTGK